MTDPYDQLFKVLGICKGCGQPVRDRCNDHIKVTEVVKRDDVWTHYFHSWKCLTEYLIKSKRVKFIAVD